MPRSARLKFSKAPAWYHLYSRMAGHRGEYPLAKPAVQRHLVQAIEHYARIYFCQVAAFAVMGNHYHLVLRFQAETPVPREELRARAFLMYPGQKKREQVDAWTEEEWNHYRRRLFDVSEFMRNLQASFARWYNRSFDRRGRFWGDRFKSVYLGDLRSVLDCMLYVELNAVRAGVVQRPEEWTGSSVYLRQIGKGSWLMPLTDVLAHRSKAGALREYRERMYYRGSVPTRDGQAAISADILERERARGFESRGMYLTRLGYFVNGLAIGTESFLREQLAKMREEGQYLRRKNPIPQLGGIHLSLREQRSHAIVF